MPNVQAKVQAGLQKMKWDYEKTLTKVRDTKNFEIDKQGRFAARGFQIALGVASIIFIGTEDATFTVTYTLTNVLTSMW